MSAYLVTRDGQELGSFEASQIQEGLKTGFFRASDWAWREGMSNWQGVSEIVGTSSAPQAAVIAAPAISNPISAPIRQPVAVKKPDSLNPYAAPASNAQTLGVSGVLPPAVINELTGTQPWVRFISILMWIGCVIMLLFMVLYLIAALLGGSTLIKAGAAGAGVAVMIMTTIGLGLSGLLIIYPTLKLSKYASNIAKLAESRSFADMAAALAEQRRFWKFQGILLIIYLSFFALFILLGLAGIGLGSMAR